MNRRWVCNDVWMDIFPLFDRPQLGLKLALLSPRFDVLVDKHFGGKSELPLWRLIEIHKDSVAAVPKLSVLFDGFFAEFALPDRPLSNKIRFTYLRIEYIDHSVLTFLRSNQQIWDKGTNLHLCLPSSHGTDDDDLPIWIVFVREIWPIFATNIRQLFFVASDDLDKLRRLISPTILTDLINLNSIHCNDLFLDDGLNAKSAGQALSKWLHTPTKDGQPKRLNCKVYSQVNFDWVNNFKEQFVRATTSASYEIQFKMYAPREPFELVNNRTQEKLTLSRQSDNNWLCNRCPIGTMASVKWEDENWDDLNTVKFLICNIKYCTV